VLTAEQLDRFASQGFVKLEGAFPRDLADRARAILWKDAGCDPDDRTTWTQPVIRLGMYSQPPFVEAANTRPLHEAFDQLVGVGKWRPCTAMGTFPVRFPSDRDAGDTGWHINSSFLKMARVLEPSGEAGLSLRELAANGFAETAHCGEVLATGDAGTVYLCHPFLVHAAQIHRGANPRFMAQPPLLPQAI
jgi:hypothetical protein